MDQRRLTFENATQVALHVNARPLGGTFYVRICDWPAENTRPLPPGQALSYPIDAKLAACFKGNALSIDLAVRTKVRGASLGITMVMGNGVFRFEPSE